MVVIYDALVFSSLGFPLDIEKMLSNQFDEPYEEIDLFVRETLLKSITNKDKIVEAIQAQMPNWKFHRLNRLAQAILLLAVTHYRYVEQVDKKIIIDNAVRLAKKYLDDGDYKLINAVLDKTL